MVSPRWNPPIRAVLGIALEEILAGVLDRESLVGKRDAAVLLIGFAGALRVSELIAVDVDYLASLDAEVNPINRPLPRVILDQALAFEQRHIGPP